MPETIETLNQRLIDHFGKFENGSANYRISWSEDQIEKRVCTHVNGVELLFPEVIETRKYLYIHNKYVLERLIPTTGNQELTTKISYEPLWTYADKNDNAIAPNWIGTKFIIDTIHERIGKHKIEKEPEIEQNTREAREERIKILESELFGNETKIGDALAYDHAVGYGVRKRNDW